MPLPLQRKRAAAALSRAGPGPMSQYAPAAHAARQLDVRDRRQTSSERRQTSDRRQTASLLNAPT